MAIAVSDELFPHRLLASLEVMPGTPCRRSLSRRQCETLAQALATDLARTVPAAADGLLVVGGSLLEPAELLRPGWPVWQALQDLAAPLLRQGRGHGELLAVGGAPELPDARLQAPDQAPAGALLAIPMLLISETDLSAVLEAELFERGSLHPPARAELAQSAQLSTQHGQLLTVHDLMALQHVQLDSAGLGGFWPLLEQLLMDPERDASVTLPAHLQAQWHAARRQCVLTFETPPAFRQRTGEDMNAYVLWQRAYRSLLALTEAHALAVQTEPQPPLRAGDGADTACWQRPAQAQDADGVTEHSHPSLGPIAWTEVRDGQRCDWYALNRTGLLELAQRFRAEPTLSRPERLCYNPDSLELEPHPR